MIALAISLAAALTPAPPLPDIAGKLPSTWPPPGWPTSVQFPGDPARSITPAAAAVDKWVEVFPHVRINRALKAVEFDSTVAWDFHNADTPRTELELLVCLPMRDKEHESLLLSQAKGAHIHAALLMVGLEPGTPGRIDFGAADEKDQRPGIRRVTPQGPAVTVQFAYTKDGKEVVDDAKSWVKDEAAARDLKEHKDATTARIRERYKAEGAGRTLAQVDVDPISFPTLAFVFGGSSVGQMRNERGEKVNVYNADELGTLIGLCTFGSETIGITRVYSSDSGVDAPSFIANNAAIPAADTPVRVRIQPDPRARVVPQSEEEEKSFPGLNDSLRQGR